MLTDTKAFFDNVIQQTMMKSPELLGKMMAQEASQAEQYLVDLISDRLSDLLRPGQPLVDQDLGISDVMVSEPDEQPIFEERCSTLALALGACECWGEEDDCPECGGMGQPGWITPDPKLFVHYVKPAIAAVKALATQPAMYKRKYYHQ